jgi:thiol-disulfide isomerase/thioredoxin
MRRSFALLTLLATPAFASESRFTFVDARGAPVEIRTEPGADRALLLHFWATWCPDCADDLAHLDQAAAGCERVRVAAVNAGDSQAQVDEFLARHPLRIDVLRDPRGEVWRRLDGRGLPANVYWSARGRGADLGPKTAAQWREQLADLGCPAQSPAN